MDLKLSKGRPDSATDPFFEQVGRHLSICKLIMGGYFWFESASEALLHLVEAAYAKLPEHQLPTTAPDFRIELRLLPGRSRHDMAEPPRVRTQSGAGLLCGVMDASNYVIVMPEQRRALVVASEDMLSHPYHLRYELIEFAVFILAARGQGLVPLHGACVGRQGRGILLLGASGSGKSTLALHSLLHGLDFLAEDAVLVQPERMLATGVANYLHVLADALPLVEDDLARRWLSEAPIIRRRSGVEKLEADLRNGPGQLAAMPLKLIAAVFVSNRRATDSDILLSPLPRSEAATRLLADQPYAAGQPGWQRFEQQLIQLGVHELHRGDHPRNAVSALQRLLD